MHAAGRSFESNLPVRPGDPRGWRWAPSGIRVGLAVCAAALLSACGGGGGTSATPAPSVSVTSPTAGATLKATTILTATASGTGPSAVQSLQFRIDGSTVITLTSAPYSYALDVPLLANGTHQVSAAATDAAGRTGTSAPVSITVDNTGVGTTLSFSLTLLPSQLFPEPTSAAGGTGSLTVNLTSGQIIGNVTLTGVTANAVEIGDAYAGSSSAALISLSANAAAAGRWDVPATTTLTAQQLTDLKAGRLYALVRSAAYPSGELRAQILPSNVTVRIATLSGVSEVPPVTSSGTGQAAVTVNSSANTAAVHVTVSGVTATGAELDTGAAGSVGTFFAQLSVDALNPNRYSNESIALGAADVANFNTGDWYVNVTTAAHPAGELRAAITAPPATLSQLQATILTTLCAGCHVTGGDSPHLAAGNTYGETVNVASAEKPALLLIKPGDPDNSYLIQKVQGTAGILGAQMPLGGTALTQAQINALRSWVSAGALNN